MHDIESHYLNSGGEFLVGVCDGEVVAMGALRRKADDRADVKRMRVRPNYHGRGFGQAILSVLESRAKELGYKLLQLDTTAQQSVAQRLYSKNGFREVGRTILGGFESILFEKVLD